MSQRDALEAFREYIGLKLHFSQDDFVYKNTNQLRKMTIDTLKARKDMYFFSKLGDKFIGKEQHRKDFLISQFLNDTNAWVGGMFDMTAEMLYDTRMSNVAKMDYLVTSDIQRVCDFVDFESFNELLLTDGDRPAIISNTRIKLHDETLACLDLISNFTSESSVNPYWNIRRKIVHKYALLLQPSESLINKIRNLTDISA